MNVKSETSPAALEPRRSTLRAWQGAALVIVPVLLILAAVVVWLNWPASPVRAVPTINLAGADPEIADAVRAARDEVEQAPRSAKAWGALAMVLHAHAFDDAADACYTAVEELDPKNANWPYLRGLLHHVGPGGPEAAAPLFERAANLNPANLTARCRLADMLLELGRLDDANQEYLKALSANPNDGHALLGLGSLAVARQQYRDSLKYLQPIAGNSAVQKRTCALLATVHERLGDKAAAESERERLSTLPDDGPGPDDPMNQVAALRVGLDVRLEKAQMLRQSQRPEETAAALREAVERHPQADEAWANLGVTLQQLHDEQGAERAMKRSIELAPKSAEYRLSLGMLQLSQRRYDEAQRTFRQTIELRPTFGPAYFGLGESLQGQGDAAGAVEAYQEALKYSPDFLPARQRLEAPGGAS